MLTSSGRAACALSETTAPFLLTLTPLINRIHFILTYFMFFIH